MLTYEDFDGVEGFEGWTDVQKSRIIYAQRFFSCDPATYTQLSSATDDSRGYPLAITQRGLPEAADLPESADGRVLISIPVSLFNADDDARIAPAIAAGLVTELTKEEYSDLLP